jgi:hypothetical protein
VVSAEPKPIKQAAKMASQEKKNSLYKSQGGDQQ